VNECVSVLLSPLSADLHRRGWAVPEGPIIAVARSPSGLGDMSVNSLRLALLISTNLYDFLICTICFPATGASVTLEISSAPASSNVPRILAVMPQKEKKCIKKTTRSLS
jgi:hypothetical protein